MNQYFWGGFTRTALHAAVTAVGVVLAAAPALAQNTTGAIGGSVLGSDGKPVAGATVTILHTETKTTSTTTTDATGHYAARGLRVGGPYTITISKDGQTDQRDGITVALAETLTFDAQLGMATSTVVVTGQAASNTFNRANMGAGTNISGAQLNALASIQRNLQDYARTDPRISQTDKERGEISAAGQNSRYNSLTIDGVTTNDTFGIEANNLPTLKQPISIDAIASVQINLSNYDVTQKGYTGANINAVTKSGTNEFKGSVYYVYRDDSLVGQRFNRTTGAYADAPKFSEDTKGFTLGGPVIPDKLFFFASYEELRSSRNAPDFGPIGDAKTNVPIAPAEISAAASLASSAYGVNAGSFNTGGSALVVKDALLKLDWTVNDNHRASLRYTKTEQSEPIYPSISASQLSLDSNWYSQGKTIETVVGQWFADWTPAFSTEAKLSYRDYKSTPVNNANLPQIALNFTGNSATGAGTRNASLLFGTERSRHYNDLGTKTSDAYFAGTWALGAHEIKAGVDYSRNDIFNAFVQDTKGNYVFRCLNSTATLTYTFGAVNCATATPAVVAQALLENFQRGRPAQYTLQVPAAGKVIGDAAAVWALTNTGLFLQDTWIVNKQLMLTGGLRLDTASVGEKPLANVAAAAPVVNGTVTGLGTGNRQTGGFGLDNTTTLDGEQLLQPRLGFNYNLDPQGKTRQQLRGGFGLFQGAAASVWLSNPYSNTGVALRTIGCGGSFAACPSADGTFSADPAHQPQAFANAQPASNVDFIEKGLAQPSVWKANLAFESELPWYGLVAGAEWLYTKTHQGIYYQQLNLGPVTGTGSDGRQLYYNAGGYDPRCWTAAGATTTGGGCVGAVTTRALRNSAYNNVFIASKTSQGGGNAVTLSLSQQPLRNLAWSAAYTRSDATEVSPLTSSTSSSNWGNRSVFNPNEQVAANSAYLVKDRINASLTWSQAFVGSYKTSLGLFYEGRKGKPYSWAYANDLNGDGFAGNDLMYIPSAPGSGEVVFAGGAADEARFWAVVEANPELRKAKGGVVKRNGSFSPYVNTFDLRISQQLPGLLAQHKGVITFDVLNVGNLLNKQWGRTDEVGFNNLTGEGGGATRNFVAYKGLDSAGKYIYSTLATTEDLTTRQAKGESQWAVQVTLRYEF